jgi:hypothetical protein
MLLEPRTLQRGYFKPEAIRSLLEEHFRGRRNHSGVLWILLVFELWHRNFLEARGYTSHDRTSTLDSVSACDAVPSARMAR